MRDVQKYQVSGLNYFELDLSLEAEILIIHAQERFSTIWILTDSNKKTKKRKFCTMPINRIPVTSKDHKDVKVYFLDRKGLVYHLFEIIKEETIK